MELTFAIGSGFLRTSFSEAAVMFAQLTTQYFVAKESSKPNPSLLNVLSFFLFAGAIGLACAQTNLPSTQLPTSGKVVSGQVGIQQSGSILNINQTSAKGVLDWSTFNVGSKAQVNFIQPSANAVTLNRVLDANPSQIFGKITAPGQVFISNPNGIHFGPTAQVDVGGLVGTTLNVGLEDFLTGKSILRSTGNAGSVLNQGRLTAADGGFIALMAPSVTNQGTVIAKLGKVAMASGSAATLEFDGGGGRLIKVQIDSGTLKGMIDNKGILQADGGLVVMTAKAANSLAESVIQNTGTVQAQTVQNQNGRILLLGDMQFGTLKVDGKLDASAPNKGDGGFIETSAAHVKIADTAQITTLAANGKTGTWLVDPQDYTVALSGGDQTGAQLSTSLATTNVTLQSSSGGQAGSGNVNINDSVAWSADNTLTLIASNNVNVNANISATGANAGLVISPNTANGSDAASGIGSFVLGTGASIQLPNVSPSSQTALIISGTPYTVINSLGSQGSVTGTDLQGINGNLAGNYALGSNIDASATAGWNAGAGLLPLGQGITSFFSGVFQGLGNSISNLHINRPSTDFVGLFGLTGSGLPTLLKGTIENLKLDAVSIVGQNYIGAAVGYSNGYIKNVFSSGSLSNGNNTSNDIGGLVGFNYGLVDKSGSSVEVRLTSAASYSIGGLVGSNRTDLLSHGVTNSYSTGNVVANLSGIFQIGGLVGYNISSISNSYSTGNISVGTTSQTVGGFVGLSTGSITNSYSTGAVHAGDLASSVGGLVGRNSGPIMNSYSKGNVTSGTFTKAIGGLIGSNSGVIKNSYASGNIQAGANSGANGFSYNGGGGLVGYNSGEIYDSYASGNVYVSGRADDFGGFVGFAEGPSFITRSYATGSVSVQLASQDIGGFAGNMNDGTITNSYATGAVTTPAHSSYVGGFIGSNWHGSSISNSYSSGRVTISWCAACNGFAGGNQGVLEKTFWNTETSGISVKDTVGDIVGITSSQMRDLSTFTNAGWSTSIWNANGAVNSGFPIFSAKLLYVRAISGTNLYGVLPSISYGLYDSYAGGSLVNGAQANGSANWSIVKDGVLLATNSLVAKSNAGVYSLTYSSGLADTSGTYALVPGSATNWTINPAPLTVTATQVSKQYDGTLSASGAGRVGVLVSGDLVNAVGSQVFLDKNVGNANKAVRASGVTIKDGANADMTANYAITYVDNTSSTITAAPLTVTATQVSKQYDGTLTAFGTGTVGVLAGTAAGDVVNATGSQAFLDKNVGNANKAVRASGVTIKDGTNADMTSNYAITYVDNSTSTITAAPLTVTATQVSKQYDGTITASGAGTVGVLAGAAAGDVVNATGSQAYLDKNVGNANKAVRASGVTIKDGTNADMTANYAITFVDNTTSTITSAPLTVTATQVSKQYDGSLSASGTGTVGVLAGAAAGDVVNAVGGQAYLDKNVGTANKAVRASGVTIKDGTNADMTSNYSITYVDNSTSTITAAPLTVTATQVSKQYDGTLTASGTGTVGVLAGAAAGDVVNATGSQAYLDKNVGNANKAVRASGVTIKDGANADMTANYAITYVDNTNSTITVAPLTVTATSVTKQYDGTLTAGGTGTVGALVSGDAINATGSQAYLDKNVGNANKAVRASGVTIKDGANVDMTANYAITYLDNTASTITAAPLTVTATQVSKQYDGSLSASGTGTVGVLAGAAAGDVVNAVGSQAFLDKNVGNANKAVRASGVTIKDGTNTDMTANYAITYVDNTTSTITAAPLTVTATQVSKQYDGTITASGAGAVGVLAGAAAGDVVNATGSQAYLDKNVGNANKAVRASGVTIKDGANADMTANYAITYVDNTSSTITAAPLTVTATQVSKLYDGALTASGTGTVGVLAGAAAGDVVNSVGSQAYLDKNVGTANKAVRASGVTIKDGANADMTANYAITYVDNTTSTITAAPLTVTATQVTKQYDGALTASGSGIVGVLAGAAAGDVVNATGSQAYLDKNVGTANKAVRASGVMIKDGANADMTANYAITYIDNSTSTITAANLQIVGVAAQNKIYDASSSANLIGPAKVTPIGTDQVTVTGVGVGVFENQNVGSNKNVTVSGLTLSGVDALNYRVIQPTAVTANITPAAMLISAISDDRIYNASSTSSRIPVINGLQGADTVSGLGQVFDSKNAGARILSVSGYIVKDGNGGKNYVVTTRTASGNIGKADLQIAGVAANSKTYDTTTQATLTGKANLSPYLGDDVKINAADVSAKFVSKSVGNDKTILVAGYKLSGLDANNYNVLQPSGLTADILPTQESLAAKVPDIPSATLSKETKLSTINASNDSGLMRLEIVVPSNARTTENKIKLQMPQSVADYFKDSQENLLVKTLDDEQLPSWIQFDAKSMIFSINSTQKSGSYPLSIKSSDKTLMVNLIFR
jgi:trimeric autotransporter adhesin